MKHAVIVPAYRAGWCLERSINSIAEQTLKPSMVMIGVDSCMESLTKALELKADHDARDKRRKGVLNIEVYWFPHHVYPYRIRNTMAVLSDADVLHFFDADDVMYPDHIKLHSKCLTPDRFCATMAEIYRDDKHLEPWDRAYGVVSIYRHTFLFAGGYEPWKCGADSEAQHRWEALGITKIRTKQPTMCVYKHDHSLTIREDTGYHSSTRQAYKDEIKRRIQQRDWSPRPIHIEHCKQATPAGDLGELLATCAPRPQPDDIEADQQADPQEDGSLVKAFAALRYMMRVHGRGVNKDERKAYDRAKAVVEP
jgi:glycosyltransferase involved in cell wall biosynthesis